MNTHTPRTQGGQFKSWNSKTSEAHTSGAIKGAALATGVLALTGVLVSLMGRKQPPRGTGPCTAPAKK